MNDQKNLILAIGLSLAILLGWQFFYEMPRIEKERARLAELNKDAAPAAGQAPAMPGGSGSQVSAPSASGVTPQAPEAVRAQKAAKRQQILAQVPRIKIETPRISGSLSLLGGRLDDITLHGYRETVDPDSAEIKLLRPVEGEQSYYAQFGWVAGGGGDIPLPGNDTLWKGGGTLAPGKPVLLSWDNRQGLTFERQYAIDESYLVTVTQRVINNTSSAVPLHPFGFLSRGGTPDTIDIYILHEGPLGVFDGTLKELDYEDMQDSGKVEQKALGGWVGITDKYWLTALVPDQKDETNYRFLHTITENEDRYQVDYLGSARSVSPGRTLEIISRLFVGAKEVKELDRYAEAHGIENFDLAIDFGWFYFLTKPFFYILSYLFGVLGNFGLAILGLTVLVKLLFFPLANKSYRSMAKMRELTPKMQEMRELYGDDRQRLNQEMMELYKREKVNPASGCLPIVVQIPVFFALYKVLFVNIEMRHAPFYGWIHDLSEKDPTSMFNLFGLIPWDPPQMLMIGVWPLLMGLTMFAQQRLNPQPADPVQAKIFMFLPIFFTFLLSQFAAGLVIYWTWNNLLSICQQWVIMKRMGVK